MKLEACVVDMFNSKEFTPEILDLIIQNFLENFKEKIVQKFQREKAGILDKMFSEYILIEVVRALYQMCPVTFYSTMPNKSELWSIFDLRYLKTYKKYKNFDRKRKSLKKNSQKIIKRNFKKNVGRIYILDTTIGEVDLSKIRKGKNVKDGRYDAVFLHSSTKGSTVGFTVCVLIDWSNLSPVKVEFFPKNASKKEIWKKMVIDTVGTKTGKIRIVLADAGFFAYQNYETSPYYRIVPVIKSRKKLIDRVIRKVESLPVSLIWWCKRKLKDAKILTKEFFDIIKMTISLIRNYDKLKKIRAQIELLFKTAKKIFGMKSLHVYFNDAAYWRIYIHLYLASLFLQYLDIQGLNINRAIELFQQKGGLV